MKIGYSVEGSTDHALLLGLQRRWCPAAELIPGHFRGTTRQSARREIRNICLELHAKHADLILFLRDANNESWREVLRADEARCDAQHKHLTIFAVCDRNVECWLAAEPDYIARHFKRHRAEFAVADPKGVVEPAFGVTRRDKKEEEIADFVLRAPLHKWLNNPSFADFYDRIRQMSKKIPACQIENLQEAKP